MAIIKCPECGAEISDKATACPKCGNPMAGVASVNVTANAQPAPVVNVVTSKSNGIAVAGLVLAILGLVLGWVPVLGWVVWFLGLLFSFIGVFRAPRGCAIAGLILSLIDLIVIVVFLGAVASEL